MKILLNELQSIGYLIIGLSMLAIAMFLSDVVTNFSDKLFNKKD